MRVLPFSIGEFADPLSKYENVDASKYALDLDVYQVAYLHSLLPKNLYRFQPEETAKRKIQSVKKALDKKRNAKSNNTDSVISNSDKFSSSERMNPESSSMQSKVINSTPSKAKASSEAPERPLDGYSTPLGEEPQTNNQFNPISESAGGKRYSNNLDLIWA